MFEVIAAAIDVGTNTVKLAVGERNADGFKLLAETVLQPRIGEGVDQTRKISSMATDRAILDIATLLQIAQQYSARNVRLFGTSAVREARNSAEVVEKIRGELGIELEILSENEECSISYQAIALDPVLGGYDGTQVVADVGGGSSELTFGAGDKIIGCTSVRVGAVRITERHISTDPPTQAEVESAARNARFLLEKAVITQEVGRVVGVGGSVVNVARMLNDIPEGTVAGVHGSAIGLDELRQLIDKMTNMRLAERRLMIGLDPERADIILGGAIILESILIVIGAREMVASARGLRHGVLYEMLSN